MPWELGAEAASSGKAHSLLFASVSAHHEAFSHDQGQIPLPDRTGFRKCVEN